MEFQAIKLSSKTNLGSPGQKEKKKRKQNYITQTTPRFRYINCPKHGE